MRKAFKLFALMTAALLLLTSCSLHSNPEDAALKLQELWSQYENIRMTVSLTADYGERVYNFRLSYVTDGTSGTLTILEPENISGIEARITPDGASLLFNGAEVFTGELIPDGLSPMEALPFMVSAWQKGLITESVFETYDTADCLCVLYYITENVLLRTWFERDTMLPVSAELISSDTTVIKAAFYDIVTK